MKQLFALCRTNSCLLVRSRVVTFSLVWWFCEFAKKGTANDCHNSTKRVFDICKMVKYFLHALWFLRIEKEMRGKFTFCRQLFFIISKIVKPNKRCDWLCHLVSILQTIGKCYFIFVFVQPAMAAKKYQLKLLNWNKHLFSKGKKWCPIYLNVLSHLPKWNWIDYLKIERSDLLVIYFWGINFRKKH